MIRKYLCCPQKHIWPRAEEPVLFTTDQDLCPVCKECAVLVPGETGTRRSGRMLYTPLVLIAVAGATALLAPDERVRTIAGLVGIVVGVIAVLVFLAIAPFAFRRHRRRRAQGMIEIAAMLGLSYSAKLPANLARLCSCVPHFRSNHRAELNDLAYGQWGHHEVILGILDYDSEGARSYGHCLGEPIAILVNALPASASFRLASTDFLRRLMGYLRPSPINLRDTAERNRFRRIFRLEDENETQVSQLFDDCVIKFFLNNPGWCVYCEHGSLALWHAFGVWEQTRRQFGRGHKGPDEWLAQTVLELLYGVGQIMLVLQRRGAPP